MPETRTARILIADDREENRYVLDRILRGEGYDCLQADCGAEALRIARSIPDLIILDVRLPDMSGYDVCRSLKENPATAAIMILQVSASFVSNHDRVRALEAGADGYLTHPIDRMVLMATVRALLRLRNAEFNSRKAAEHWQTTFDSLAEGVALVDDKGCVARWNGSFRSMCGSKADLDEGEDAARLLERLIGTSDPLRQNTALFRGEFECGRKTIQLAVSRVSGDGAQEKVLTLTDVTDRKLAEYAIRTAEKLAATGRLANAIAHEINNPLEALTNLVYLARSTAPLESVYALLDSASRELDRVARITKQSLAFHRDTHIPVEIDLGSLLADVIGMVERSATSHRVRIVLQQQSAEKAFGYPGQLNQVFSNLLRNATEAAPAGSEVIVRLKAIERTGRRGNRITIHDRGSGIPLEIQSSVFDPFFTTKALRGSGLGLWVSKSLVAKHDGTIRFRSCSHAGRSGTSFEVFLPATDPWYLSE